MTRQEIKQLDTEIPWREIMTMSAAVKDKYVASVVKEYEGWVKWSGIRPLTDAEAEKVFSRPPAEKENAEEPSGIQRQKPRIGGLNAIMAKCRVVLIGCNDPDLRQLSRDSPTPRRLAEYIVLSTAAAGANRLFNNDGRKLFLWLSDAAQAFLQGRQDSTERSGPIYMAPLNDPLIVEAGACPARLYEVTGSCYVLANAPRVWYNKVRHFAGSWI